MPNFERILTAKSKLSQWVPPEKHKERTKHKLEDLKTKG